ncbi:hypothetical protein [Nonomuraea angiospora]
MDSTQLTLPIPRRRKRRRKPRRRGRWVPCCDDCGRRIWSKKSLRRRLGGLLLGGGCYRKRVRATRRLVISSRITVRPPGDIPGQLDITTPHTDQEEP